MTTQPAALRLADKMSSYSLSSGYAWHCHKAAAELRRLHESNKDLLEALLLANIECEHVHHSLKDRHTLIENCPVKARIVRAISKAEGGAA